jgi:transaldolase / glucose-6-phosphate isomerase
MNNVKALQDFGQSVWLDDLRRDLFTSGEFQRLIDEDGLRGVTSNPSIFEKAIVGSPEYLSALREIDRDGSMTVSGLYEALAIRDIREAADLLRPVYDATNGVDGYVSLEVSPLLAHDTVATISEARRLWRDVDRDNLMIKVPASVEGLPAIRQLTSEGINVNITLLFGVDRYEQVAQAYMDGLSTFVDRGGNPARVNSVASMFVSRIDTIVDRMLQERFGSADVSDLAGALSLQGEVAIANAKLAYLRYQTLCRSSRWQFLASRGGRPQRLLWASTSTKNARYGDVRYVEELIGADTITTLTPATLAAFRDHGRTRASLDERIDHARAVIDRLARTGIQLDAVTDTLLEEGLASFRQAFDSLLAAVTSARSRPAMAGTGGGE